MTAWGPLIVALIALSGVLLVGWWTRRSADKDREQQEKHWTKDREQQEQHWAIDRERQEREWAETRTRETRGLFIDHKRDRYAAFLRAADDHERQLNRQRAAADEYAARKIAEEQVPPLGSSDEIGHIAEEVNLLAPEVGRHALQMYYTLTYVDSQYAYVRGQQTGAGGSTELLAELAEAYTPHRSAFVQAARSDLGLDEPDGDAGRDQAPSQ